MKILLIGTSGKLGFEIYKILKKDKKNVIVHMELEEKNSIYHTKIIYLNF